MKYTQNIKIKQITDKTLVVGVDIAKKVHFARAFDWRGIEVAKTFSFKATGTGFSRFNEWVREIAGKNRKDKIVVGFEPTGHYWFTFAQAIRQEKMMAVQVNPFHVSSKINQIKSPRFQRQINIIQTNLLSCTPALAPDSAAKTPVLY